MCDFEELESWPGVSVGRCGVCGEQQQLMGAIEISHRGAAPAERFAVCARCRQTALRSEYRAVREGGLRSRIADSPVSPCRFLREAQAGGALHAVASTSQRADIH